MKFSKHILALIVLSLVLCLQAEAKEKIVVGADNKVTINFKDLEINDFVKLVSNILNKNILLQAPIPGKVDFVSTTSVYKKDLPTILQSVLGSKGFSLVDRGSFLEVVKSKQAAQYNLPLVNKVGDSYIQMVTKIIPIRGVSSDLIAAKVKHLTSSSGTIATIRDNNSIIITDFPKNIDTIQQIIENIESSDSMKVKFFRLQNAEVSYIYPSLLSIVKSRFNSKINTDKVTVAADKTGNTIVAVGTPRNLAIVRNIIKRFDVQGAMPMKRTAVISLKNTESKDVVKVVSKIVASKRKTNPQAQTTVVSEPNTNSIVISGTKEDIAEVKSILEELDKEQRQVYVRARIIEISKDASEKLGVEYGFEAGKANSSGLYTIAMNMGNDGTSMALSSTLASAIDIPTLTSGLALGASIDFLTTNGAANTVSEPSILCLNNQESKIYVGQTQSIITSATTTDSTTDLSRNTYTREDIGLTLKIKPRISNDGKVTLEAETTIEDVAPNSTAGTPTTTKREVTTKAIVKNGESVIVGGLIRDKSGTSVSKVPFLGSIPVLGELFTHTSDTDENINIVIILTPYIINTSENLTSLRKELVELDNLQDKYNKNFIRKLRERSTKFGDASFSDMDKDLEEDIKEEEKAKTKVISTTSTSSEPKKNENLLLKYYGNKD